jgi:hypothetical protein
MPETRTYSGGSHCGRVRYEATLHLDRVIRWNCSICRKRGLLWSFIGPEAFVLRSGGDALADYQFGRRTIHHLFCPTCGVESFARGRKPDGAESVAINVRCLDDVDPDTLATTPFNGRDL